MRTSILILLLSAMTATGFAQSMPGIQFNGDDGIVAYDPAVHDAAMKRFQQLYNERQDGNINAMFADFWKGTKTDVLGNTKSAYHYPWDEPMWEDGTCAGLLAQRGNFLSFAYIGDMDDDPGVKVYRVEFERRSYTISFSLDNEHKFLTFRHGANSKHVRKLVREYNKSVVKL